MLAERLHGMLLQQLARAKPQTANPSSHKVVGKQTDGANPSPDVGGGSSLPLYAKALADAGD